MPESLASLLEWVRTGGMLGLLALSIKLYVDNRKLRLEESREDREGWGELIKLLREQVNRMEQELKEAAAKIKVLENERDSERAQVMALVNQLNRTQSLALKEAGTAAIVAPSTSAAIDKMLERKEEGADK